MSGDRALHVVVCVQPPRDDGAPSHGDRVLGALDLRAVDYAVRLERRMPGAVRVTAVAAGGGGAVTALRECLAMGVGHTVHVVTEDDEAQIDGVATAARL